MHSWWRTLFLAIALLSAASGTALADKRVALVIGNSEYRNVARLPNPANDAAAVAGLFKSTGFEVDLRLDLDSNNMRRALREFSQTARDADVVVVFYAGHGIEMNGTNYLIPTDAKLEQDFDVEDETVSLDRVLATAEPAKRLRLVILDACRDNPFMKSMKRSVASRSIGRGLARIEPTTTDTLVAFAAKAGSIAVDGAGANSPFTAALLKHVATPGLDIRIALGRVHDDVLESTRRQQEPTIYGSLGGADMSLVPAATGPQAEVQRLQPGPTAPNPQPVEPAKPIGPIADAVPTSSGNPDGATPSRLISPNPPHESGPPAQQAIAPLQQATAPPQQPTTPAQQPTAQTLSAAQLDPLVAPIALYPDNLLGQILIASTYPLEVVVAARWSAANPKVKGQPLEDAMQKQTWDASVKALAAVPQVLAMMSDKIDWTQSLGDAYLVQPDDVAAAIQRLRLKAEAGGNLRSSNQQRVKRVRAPQPIIVEGRPEPEYIVIEPIDSGIIYVPIYDPFLVYGVWVYPGYRPFFWHPQGYVVAGPIGFGAPFVVGAALWAHFNWESRHVERDILNYNKFNHTNIVNNAANQTWQHDPLHRGNIPYSNAALQQKFGKLGPNGNADLNQGLKGGITHLQPLNLKGGTNPGNSGATDKLGKRSRARTADLSGDQKIDVKKLDRRTGPKSDTNVVSKTPATLNRNPTVNTNVIRNLGFQGGRHSK
jgi:Protein of unknown function (DUF3300)/Caspase domain